MRYLASNQSDIKNANQKAILNLLREQGAMSRAQLAEKLDTSKPTISKNVMDLLEQGRLIEKGKDDNAIGKKGLLVDIHAEYRHVLVIDLSKEKLRFAVINLTYDRKHYESRPLDQDLDIKVSLDHFLNDVVTRIDQFEHAIISYPGISNKDRSYGTSNDPLIDRQLTQLIEGLNRRNIPYKIYNNVNLAVIGEKQTETYRSYKNLYYISVERGVGSAMMIDHQLYSGERHAAGEIGYMLCSTEKGEPRENLEQRIRIRSILHRYELASGELISFEELRQRTNQGEKLAVDLYQQIIKELGIAIINISSILDIHHFLLAGKLFELHHDFVTDLSQFLKRYAQYPVFLYPSVRKDASILGAAHMGVRQYFE